VSLSQRDHSQAYESGKAARRGCKRIGDVPYRGKTERVRKLAEAWCQGFADQDAEMKRRVEAQA